MLAPTRVQLPPSTKTPTKTMPSMTSSTRPHPRLKIHPSTFEATLILMRLGTRILQESFHTMGVTTSAPTPQCTADGGGDWFTILHSAAGSSFFFVYPYLSHVTTQQMRQVHVQGIRSHVELRFTFISYLIFGDVGPWA